MNEFTTVRAKPGQIMKKFECYAGNAAEMSAELRTALIDSETDELKDIKLKEAVAAIQAAYDQARETIYECAGETITMPMPEGFAGQAVQMLLMTLGLKLDKPVTADSTVV